MQPCLGPQGNEPGVYTIILCLDRAQEIHVGSLGTVGFAAGYYSYTGSARGSGGLKRVDRHMRILKGLNKTRKWHIDYLLPAASFRGAFITRTSKDLECCIAGIIGMRLLSMKGFGCTDCRCTSHLHYSPDPELMHEAVRLAHQKCQFGASPKPLEHR
jgi:endonuclease-3